MGRVTEFPSDLRNTWHKVPGHPHEEFREEFGGISPFHWHCVRPMKRVNTLKKFGENERPVATSDGIHPSWICSVCGRREYGEIDSDFS